MIHQMDIYGKDKVETAIDTMRFFEPKDGSGYFLAFSGGKDSVVLKALADMAGVKYDAHSPRVHWVPDGRRKAHAERVRTMAKV